MTAWFWKHSRRSWLSLVEWHQNELAFNFVGIFNSISLYRSFFVHKGWVYVDTTNSKPSLVCTLLNVCMYVYIRSIDFLCKVWMMFILFFYMYIIQVSIMRISPYFLIPIRYICVKIILLWYPLSMYMHHARTFIFRFNRPSFNSVWNDIHKMCI